jgi:hypothetical protein
MYRLSGFSVTVLPEDWENLTRTSDPGLGGPNRCLGGDINMAPTMISAAMIISIAHVRLFSHEVQYNYRREQEQSHRINKKRTFADDNCGEDKDYIEVCIYVCMYIYIYIYIYVFVYIYIYMYIHVFVYLNLHIYVNVNKSILNGFTYRVSHKRMKETYIRKTQMMQKIGSEFTHICINIYVCVNICLYLCIYINFCT